MNSVQLIGRLVRDPVLVEHDTTGIARFRLAFDQSSNATGYVDVTTFGHTAEAVLAHKSQGDRVAITGSLRHSEWDAADGAKRRALAVAASRVDFLDRKQDREPAVEHTVKEGAGNGDIPL